ncbi:dihydrolipoamide acetyltransferase family protein [Staphylococcus pettenkoferi]|uniref:dihydrolipoamide acetyltransferase family protein n=1 Tax=Staphylococcus pettenkoferi TaxID=170573 RepID=UPI00066A3F55|nr:dihydrolipoamide acetyltransferase family protein [Staphylococcus pettenkoferi]MCI2803476.1 2-oxo acid dehydrogenase subunit E2 [Staphylococcus pettenkoferi]MCY1586048.1 2-oxo acid dehydrogenase subunit E2 [Staphylococcus pettenkoferi]MCY1614828.1 2-oxo acid dehydrogenase subunit E2 [Staphylococcus pettenkoferi]PNZ88919.1 2-oxo acid dehydrogenase subunit E2 [Staphylococcus pettenkoferi]QQC37401.1 2-oxo acid dehydrogenase subunit E2 [Staphylococcus pettenkoferi]
MELKMPKLGESVHEGTIEQWLVSVGDTVEEYDPICEVITDKVTAEVPSTHAGTIQSIDVEEGETVSVGSVICHLEVEGEEDSSSASTETEEEQSEASDVSSQDREDQSEQTSTTPSSASQVTTSQSQATSQPKNNGRYSPVVFRLASEHDIDLSQVEGTGFEGRVTKKDIEKAIQTGNNNVHSEPSQQSQASPAPAQSSQETVAPQDGDSTIPVAGVRKQIANNMVRSATEIPHGWMMVEADATSLVNTRNQYKADFKKKEGYNLTYFAFFIKAVAESLKEYPLLNSSWQGDEIVVHKDINISIAVADENKLYVPVIKHADEKSIKGIAREVNELATKARQQKLTAEDMVGGTFTVNSTGTFGSVSSMGIINHPQAAILQVESIVKKPVVIDDMIAIRHMVNLCISIDHRILDGLLTGRFMQAVKKRVEQYSIEYTSIY